MARIVQDWQTELIKNVKNAKIKRNNQWAVTIWPKAGEGTSSYILIHRYVNQDASVLFLAQWCWLTERGNSADSLGPESEKYKLNGNNFVEFTSLPTMIEMINASIKSFKRNPNS